MDFRQPKWAMALFFALLTLMGCENPTETTAAAENLALTLVGTYGVAHPNVTGSQTNYLVLAVEAGNYTQGTYTLGDNTVTPTPVLTDGGRTTLIKIATTAGGSTTLTVKEGETSVLDEAVTFEAAGVAAPGVLYGEKFMTFSEFFHDVTADIAEIKPSRTAFAATGYVAEPKKFINAGTRTGNNSAGDANGTPKWTETDLLPKVDAISSATYGDNPHFVPTKNLAINYPDPMTKADWHEVTGIKAVEVGVDFDLYANADLLRQADRAVATSAAVLAKLEGIAWKVSTAVYKAKYLWPDASWGRRDQTAITEAKGKDWPKAIGGTGGATVSASYGGTWADKVISVDFAPLTAPLDNQALWNDYFDYVYAGYVEDLQTGHREPLVWLQNLFSHRGHTNLEAAITRAGFSRLNSLSPAGSMRLVIFAHGFKDIIIESVDVVADGASVPDIEQGSVFYKDAEEVLLNSEGAALTEGNVLHVRNSSTKALADFAAKSGVIKKGGTEIPAAAYALAREGEGEIAITIKPAFFSGNFQGAYVLSINSDTTTHPTTTFTVNRIIERPTLQQGEGARSAADTADNAITVTTGGGDIIFNNADFAKAIVVSAGRTSSTIAIESGEGTAPAIGTVLTATEGVYAIKAGALAGGITYKLSLLAPNIVKGDRTNLAPVVYYIKVQ
jgi:hypothetical protein